MQDFSFIKNKSLIIEIFIALLMLAIGYYLVFFVKKDNGQVFTSDGNKQVLTLNFLSLLQSFKDKSFNLDLSLLNKGDFLSKSEDFSITVDPVDNKGRNNPFIPYANTRSVH